MSKIDTVRNAHHTRRSDGRERAWSFSGSAPWWRFGA
jgi:hypothetical protein